MTPFSSSDLLQFDAAAFCFITFCWVLYVFGKTTDRPTDAGPRLTSLTMTLLPLIGAAAFAFTHHGCAIRNDLGVLQEWIVPNAIFILAIAAWYPILIWGRRRSDRSAADHVSASPTWGEPHRRR